MVGLNAPRTYTFREGAVGYTREDVHSAAVSLNSLAILLGEDRDRSVCAGLRIFAL